jgi:hypothetical protein
MKNRRPEVAASGLFLDNRTQPEAPSKFNPIYIFFRLFARPEVWILYFLKKFDASAVDRYFMCVGAVGGGRSIAVIYAVGSLNKRLTEKLRGAIGKRKKVVKPTVREKKDGG